jgi:eukaryotic-like serine/threonine-protein kinase
MTPQRRKKIDELVQAALERSDAERASFLHEACGGDDELRREVEARISYQRQATRLLEEPALRDDAGLIGEYRTGTEPMERRTISHYSILRKLGEGGMGEVYLAQDTTLDRKVAIKFLSQNSIAGDQGRKLLVREARAAAALDHPHICAVYEVGEGAGYSFIVMQYIDGETLAARIRRQPLDLFAAIEVAVQVADALAEAHSHGITHRDIKPQNIMLTGNNRVKVLDFGLAKVVRDRQSSTTEATESLMTEHGMLIGTLQYMSPEQLRGEAVDARSDLFNLGVVLYEMIAGRVPFAGRSAAEMLVAILQNPPASLASQVAQLPPALERLVSRCLAKHREQRYPSAKELLTDLKGLAAQLSQPQPAAGPSLAIAVLPFINMSADPENEYFCDGLSEDLLSSLSKIEALRVAARTSAFSFKGKEADIRRIGEMLNVGTVLEGSVRKVGSRVRITAQLINVADGYHVWSERYDREMQDIFDVQDEISLAIVDALKVKLLGAEKAAVLKRHTDNTEAHQLYLLGRYHYNKWTADGFKKSIECYERAIEKEPNYALAFTGLYGCYSYLGFFGFLSPREFAPKMKATATRALAIDSALAESHLCVARLKHSYEWDWAGAELEFIQALNLNPNYAEARQSFGGWLALMGRTGEAITQLELALELDPLSLLGNMNVAWTYWGIGLYDRLHELASKLIELEPNFFGGHQLLGLEFWSRGKLEQAISEYRRAVELGSSAMPLGALGSLYALVGEREKAQQILDQLMEIGSQRYVPRCSIALVYAGMGERDRSFEFLDQACDQHEGLLPTYLKYARFLIPQLNSDPHYAALLRRIGLPV